MANALEVDVAQRLFFLVLLLHELCDKRIYILLKGVDIGSGLRPAVVEVFLTLCSLSKYLSYLVHPLGIVLDFRLIAIRQDLEVCTGKSPDVRVELRLVHFVEYVSIDVSLIWTE